MSNRFEQVIEGVDPVFNSQSFDINGYRIEIVWIGYDLSSLTRIYPVCIISDLEEGASGAIETAVEFISNSDEIFVKAAGDYDPPVAESHRVECGLSFYRLTEDSSQQIQSRSNSAVRQVRELLIEKLESNYRGGDREIYRTSYPANDGWEREDLVFEFSFLAQPPETKIPHPLEPPDEEVLTTYYDTELPCFIVTDSNFQRDGRTRFVSPLWEFPVL